MRWLTTLLLVVSLVAADEPPLWLVIAPAPLAASVEPLAKHRAAQGLRTVVHPGPVEAALEKHKPDFLVLVGDHAKGCEKEPWYVPAPRAKLYRWRAKQAGDYAADALWGDLDGDGLPDCAVGRIPARSAKQVAVAVAKTIAYEKRTPTVEDLRLVVWAGAPGYSPFIDAMATRLLVSTVRTNAPRWMSPWIISADAEQALCGWPPDHPMLFSRSLRKGALLGAILAHGNADLALSMKHDDRWIVYRAEHAAKHLKGDEPCAPVVILACNCGEHDRAKATLGEHLFFLPGGPVVTIAATTESHPLTNYYTGTCLLRAINGRYGRRDRIGALWHEAQLRAATERDAMIEGMLKNAEGKLEAEIDIKKLRADQRRMYALLGDPALRIPLPKELKARIDRDGKWTVERDDSMTQLFIARRPLTPPAIAAGGDEKTRRAAFVRANELEGYTRIRALDAEHAWSGVFEEKGRYRLVATGPDGVLKVAVLARW